MLKMSTVSCDTSRESDATDWWLQQQSNGPAFSIQLSVFQFCNLSLKSNVLGQAITQASLEMQLQLCPERRI